MRIPKRVCTDGHPKEISAFHSHHPPFTTTLVSDSSLCHTALVPRIAPLLESSLYPSSRRTPPFAPRHPSPPYRSSHLTPPFAIAPVTRVRPKSPFAAIAAVTRIVSWPQSSSCPNPPFAAVVRILPSPSPQSPESPLCNRPNPPSFHYLPIPTATAYSPSWSVRP